MPSSPTTGDPGNLDRYLEAVDRRISEATQSLGRAGPVVGPLAAGGSRWRARLLWDLAHRGADAGALADGGAAIELLHLGTLLHDDIVDGAAERRHQTAVHEALGVPVAIWSADALFGRAVALAGAVGPSAAVAVAVALERIGESQVLESSRPPLEDYWCVVDGKTGALFVAVVEVADALLDGALGASARRSAAALGQLFQYLDDLHDVTAPATSLGKPVGLDEQNRLSTLPAADLARSPDAVRIRLGGLRDAVLEPIADGPLAVPMATVVDELLAAAGGLRP